MTKAEKVKYYYEAGLWSEKRVMDAVKKGWITAAEADEILARSESKVNEM